MKSIIAAAFGSLLLLSGGSLAQQPQPFTQGAPPIKRTVLQRLDVAGTSIEVVFVKVEISANSRIDRHTHPGPVMAHVVEGRSAIVFDGEAPRWYSVGESFQIEGGRIHAEVTEASPVSLLVVFTVEKGKPLAAPAPN
jgi:quercetin dioxygenase-like cupin family protein